MSSADKDFYQRADAHISLSNDQLTDATAGKVCASMMYGTARFSAWLSTFNVKSGEELAQKKEELIEFFVSDYKKMLEEHMNDYTQNFDKYIKPKDS